MRSERAPNSLKTTNAGKLLRGKAAFETVPHGAILIDAVEQFQGGGGGKAFFHAGKYHFGFRNLLGVKTIMNHDGFKEFVIGIGFASSSLHRYVAIPRLFAMTATSTH